MKSMMVFVFFLVSSVVYASLHESIPSWHWSYSLIESIQLRGGFMELNPLNRPYTRGQVAMGLVEIRKQIESGKLVLSVTDNKQFIRLVQEFKNEISKIAGKNSTEESLILGTRLQEDVFQNQGNDIKIKGIYRFSIGADLGEYVFVQNTMNFDQYRVDDPLYVGKKWRGVVGFTEQVYASVVYNRFQLKFGRDFLRWGTGRSGTLLFSDICRPLDKFSGSFNIGPFRFSFLTSVLDAITWIDSTGSGITNRYLSAHRVDLGLLGGRLRLAASEAILYGENNRSLDWIYVNPFMIYHGEQMNQNDRANTLGTLDLLFYPIPKIQLYGSVLIDDIQVEKTGPGDLEPNEIGWIAGGQWADPFMIPGLTFFGEYARVTNRTYKTPTLWEKYVFRNEPLGHPLGHDFDTWMVGADKWFGSSLYFQIGYNHIRKGEGSLLSPWDSPWMNYSVDEGYSEPFPTGIVEKKSQFQILLRFYPSTNWGIEADLCSNNMKNVNHINGANKQTTTWRIGIWFEGDVLFNF